MNALMTGVLVLSLAAGPQPAGVPQPAGAPQAAGAPQPAAGPLQVRHAPVAEVNAGSDLVLRAQVTPAWRLQALVAHWRFSGEAAWREAPFEKSADGTFAAVIQIPAEQQWPVEYYVVARDTDGKETRVFASPEAPQPVIVQRSEGELQRESLLEVYGNRRSKVSLFSEYVSYIRLGTVTTTSGDTYADWYYRAEADYLYRLFEGTAGLRVDSIRVGMGTLRGMVPSQFVPSFSSGGLNTRVGLDYGFSEVDLSLHPLFGLAGKLTFGGNARGFAAGLGGKVRIGRPRGSRVELEADYVSGIGFTGTFRLAWDTVPRLPMSAAAQVTNVPGGPLGIRLLYHVEWELTDAFSLGAQLGYEARETVGGGPSLGVGAAFAW